jgi:hypothetical protein
MFPPAAPTVPLVRSVVTIGPGGWGVVGVPPPAHPEAKAIKMIIMAPKIADLINSHLLDLVFV